jgi:hypothetical protein
MRAGDGFRDVVGSARIGDILMEIFWSGMSATITDMKLVWLGRTLNS